MENIYSLCPGFRMVDIFCSNVDTTAGLRRLSVDVAWSQVTGVPTLAAQRAAYLITV
jgi:hypothetical protein